MRLKKTLLFFALIFLFTTPSIAASYIVYGTGIPNPNGVYFYTGTYSGGCSLQPYYYGGPNNQTRLYLWYGYDADSFCSWNITFDLGDSVASWSNEQTSITGNPYDYVYGAFTGVSNVRKYKGRLIWIRNDMG